MRADCPTTHVFAVRSGQPVCECPAGTDFERNAAGEWRCTAPQVANVANPFCYRQDGSCPVGNPVMPGIAAKVQTEVDYEGAGAHPLSFTRSFRSQGARPYVEPGAWSHWVHNWARRIDVYPEPGHRGRAFVIREDASQRIYGTDGGGTWTSQQVGDRNGLTEQRDANGARAGFEYRLWADDSVEYYDPAGRLLRVVQRNGWTNTLTYSDGATPASIAPRPGLLISVRNHFGRELRLTYDAAGRLAELLPPGAVSGTAPGSSASPIRYAHNEAAGLGAGVPALNQLTAVAWQDGHVRRYHYENAQFPQWLTGRTDELGVRIATYTYNTDGQLEREAGPGGVNAMEFVYRGTTTEVTDRSGATPTTSVYSWETASGVIRPTTVSAPCPQCGKTSARTFYNAAGDVARRVDHDGRITFYTYDAKGRETERARFPASYSSATTRPALNVAERVVSTKWHATWNLPTQVAEPQKVTAYTYGTGGRLTGESWTATTDATGAAKFTAVKTGSTLATGWSYNASHLATTVTERTDNVETQRWTLAYNLVADPTRIVDVTGGTRRADLAYNMHGQIQSGLTPDRVVVSAMYDSRGNLVREAHGQSSTTLSYDARGLIVRAVLPGAATLTVSYDALGGSPQASLDGRPIDATTLAGTEGTNAGRGRFVAARPFLERLSDLLLRPAAAQGRFGPVGGPYARPPRMDPELVLMSRLPPDQDALRRLAEYLRRMCECDPLAGPDRPTLTPAAYVHLLLGGHLFAMWPGQSYFTVNVRQSFVDEVMASPTLRLAGQSPTRTIYDAQLPYYVGRVEFPQGSGIFVETRKVRLVVSRTGCGDDGRKRNELVTMHPGWERSSGP